MCAGMEGVGGEGEGGTFLGNCRRILELEITLLNSLIQKKNNALNCALDKMSIFLAQQTNPNCF